MTGENPYAPPHTTELESRDYYTHRTWIIYSGTLLVRKGTTLPNVDLDNGDHLHAHFPIELSPPAFFNRRADAVHAFSCKRKRFIRFMDKFGGALLFGALLISFFWSLFEIHLINPFWIIFFVVMIPRRFGRSKLVVEESAKRGWLRISKVHPQALHYLRGIAKYMREEAQKPPVGTSA